MRAPITDKHLLEMMWERFPEIMKRAAEQPAPVQPTEWAEAHGNYQGRGVISNAAMPTPVQSCYCPNCEALSKELAGLKAQQGPLTDEDMRSEFEQWHKDNFVQPLDLFNNSYRNMHVRNRWQGWVAAHGIKENT